MPRPSPNTLPPVLAAASAVVLALAACDPSSTSKPSTPAPSSSRAAAPAASAAPSPTPSRELYEYVPQPQREAFTKALTAIDPGLTYSVATHLRRATYVCYDLYAGKSDAELLKLTAFRYDGGHATVPAGSAKARQILAAVKKWMCSSKQLRDHYRATHGQPD